MREEISIQLALSLYQRETVRPELAPAVEILDAHATDAAELAVVLINEFLRDPGEMKKALHRRYVAEMGGINQRRTTAGQSRIKGVSASDLSRIIDIVSMLGGSLYRVFLGLPLPPYHPDPGDDIAQFFSELRGRLMTELEAAGNGQFPAYKAISSNGGL